MKKKRQEDFQLQQIKQLLEIEAEIEESKAKYAVLSESSYSIKSMKKETPDKGCNKSKEDSANVPDQPEFKYSNVSANDSKLNNQCLETLICHTLKSNMPKPKIEIFEGDYAKYDRFC